MSVWIEWSIVGVLVLVAAFLLIKLLLNDPCSGCSLSQECKKKGKRNKKGAQCP